MNNTPDLSTGNSFISSGVMKDVFLRMTIIVITVTGKVINNADTVNLLVPGPLKSGTVGQILRKEYDYPASEIQPSHCVTTRLPDKEAADGII